MTVESIFLAYMVVMALMAVAIYAVERRQEPWPPSLQWFLMLYLYLAFIGLLAGIALQILAWWALRFEG